MIFSLSAFGMTRHSPKTFFDFTHPSASRAVIISGDNSGSCWLVVTQNKALKSIAMSATNKPVARVLSGIQIRLVKVRLLFCKYASISSFVIKRSLPSIRTLTGCHSGRSLRSKVIFSLSRSRPPNKGWMGRIADTDKGLRRFKATISFPARIQPPINWSIYLGSQGAQVSLFSRPSFFVIL